MSKKIQYNTSSLPQGFTYTAHSGCMATADNSLESIVTGAEQGAQIVEIDLRFSADGTPVLSHDKPKGGEVTLDAAFETVSKYSDLRVNVDVKECTGQLAQVYTLAQKHGIENRIFFTGLFENDVPIAKKACPDVPCWLNIDLRPKFLHTKGYLQSLVDKVRKCDAVGINMNKSNATKELADLFHKNALQVSVWTVNEEQDILAVLDMNPDNITTRRPDLFHNLFAERL